MTSDNDVPPTRLNHITNSFTPYSVGRRRRRYRNTAESTPEPSSNKRPFFLSAPQEHDIHHQAPSGHSSSRPAARVVSNNPLAIDRDYPISASQYRHIASSRRSPSAMMYRPYGTQPAMQAFEVSPRPGPAPEGMPGYNQQHQAKASQHGYTPAPQHAPSENGLDRKNSGSKHAVQDEDDDLDGPGSKRRRVQRACDVCRRKKIRCDGFQPEKNACSNCITYGQECKFEEAAKRRAPPRSYVEALEARMERMDRLVQELAPGVDFCERIGRPVRLPDDTNKDKDGSQKASSTFVKPSPPIEPSQPASSILPSDPSQREALIARLGGSHVSPSPNDTDSDEGSSAAYHDEDIAFVTTRTMQPGNGPQLEVCFRQNPAEEQAQAESSPSGQGIESVADEPASFIGNSSNFHLVPALGKINSAHKEAIEGWSKESHLELESQKGLRPAYWSMPKCLTANPFQDLEENASIREKDFIRECWPVPDLEKKLVDTYFAWPHRAYPVLNEAVFRKDLGDPAKRDNEEWSMVALAVFALASRYVDDPRVLQDDLKGEHVLNTRGAKWYNACRRIGFRLLWPSPNLLHMQAMVLTVIYINGTPLAHTLGWSVLGLIFRLLQASGAHRKVTAARLGFSTYIEESWKRLWWVTYMLDREMATSFGRPMAAQDEDFDVEKPQEIDDDILAMPKSPSSGVPKQPVGKPASISGFVCGLKLDEILGRTLRTIYAISKAKASRGVVGRGWDQLIVAEIDSSLNLWLDEVPSHLTYNPDEPNSEWLLQSTLLYSKYYYCQILVHRPFIAGPKTNSSLNFPSLAITTNAARSCIQMMWTLHERNLLDAGGSTAVLRTFEAGCVLLLVGWGSKKTGQKPSSSTLSDIKKSLKIMRIMESKWVLAGRLGDLLAMLLRAIRQNPDGTMNNEIQLTEEEDDSGKGSHVGDNSDLSLRVTFDSGRSRKAKPQSGANKQPLPLSTQDLGTAFSASSSESQTAVSGVSTPDFSGLSSLNNGAPDWPTQLRQAGNSEQSDPSARIPQGDSNPFAEFLPRSGSIGGGLDANFGSPLDMPSFASALFGTSGTPGNFFGTQGNNPYLAQTPGAQNYFSSSGFPASMTSSGPSAEGTDGSMQSDPSHAGLQTLSNMSDSSSWSGANGNQQHDMMPPPNRASIVQQQRQHQASTPQQQPQINTSDPFNDVFRDLWTAQEIFASDANTANHFHF
ncbi:unnamed protein product [Sympodiomycopsis kandeliae]